MARRFSVSGGVHERITRRPRSGLVVRAHDPSLPQAPLGAGRTDAGGRFQIRFSERDLRDRGDGWNLLLTVVDVDAGEVLHAAPHRIRWDESERAEVEIELPAIEGGDRKRPELLDSHGRELDVVEAGGSVLLAVRDLEPDSHHLVRVVDERGEEVLTATLLSDRYGTIAPTAIWPDVGIGDPERGGRYAFVDVDEATAAIGGRQFVVELRPDEGDPVEATFSVAKELTRPRLLPTDEGGRLRRGLLAGRDPLYVSGRNLPAGSLVDLYLVARQFGWHAGDPFTPVVGSDGTEAVTQVRLRPDETRFDILLWDADRQVPGSYDLIARTVVPYEFRARERRLRPVDLVSEGLLTTLVIRTDVFAYKPVHLGCVMAHEVSGRRLSGPPYFRFTNNFPRGTEVWAALDPAGLMPTAVGRKVRISVAPHKDATAWDASNTFTEVLGTGAEIVTSPGCINANEALVWSNPQHPGQYDLVVDFGNNDPDPANFAADGSFDPPHDMIDGYFTVGFHVTDDPSVTGPHPVGATNFDEPAVTIPAAGTWYSENPFVIGSSPSGTLDLPLRAVVRYPATSGGVDTPVSTAAPSWPVVLVSPGQGLVNTGYTYLLDHLASHGFVAAAIDVGAINGGTIVGGGSFDSRAHAALAHLALLRTKHQNAGLLQGRLDLTRIVVMGHSRGGDGALATAVFNQALGLGWGIKGVIALAPVDWSGTGPLPLTLSSGAYLCLHGTNDGDVGRFGGAPFSTGFNGLGFRAYDRATTEKAMVLIRDATHNLFNSDATSEHHNHPTAVHLSRSQHETLLRGYVNAFAQWHLQGRTEQRAYFTGELRLPAVESIEVLTQYRPKSSDVRTLDSFQSAPAIGSNTLGGTVTTASLAVPALEDALGAVEPSTPHQTRGLRLRWNSASARYTSGVPLGASRDVSAYAVLSFRVSQTFGYLESASDGLGSWPHQPPLVSAGLDAGMVSTELRQRLALRNVVMFGPTPTVTTLSPGWRWRVVDGGVAYLLEKAHMGPVPQNPPAPPYYYDLIVIRLEAPQVNVNQVQDLYVRLTTAGGGPARSIRAGYFGAIPFPMRPVIDPINWHMDELRVLAAMRTIRIPLSAWTIKCLNAPIVDLTNVESVTFELNATGRGELLVDDIEFAS